MTAPTNALMAGGEDLRLIEPGERFEASFSIAVTDPISPGGSGAA